MQPHSLTKSLSWLSAQSGHTCKWFHWLYLTLIPQPNHLTSWCTFCPDRRNVFSFYIDRCLTQCVSQFTSQPHLIHRRPQLWVSGHATHCSTEVIQTLVWHSLKFFKRVYKSWSSSCNSRKFSPQRTNTSYHLPPKIMAKITPSWIHNFTSSSIFANDSWSRSLHLSRSLAVSAFVILLTISSLPM